MGGERGSTTRQRLAGKICCSCKRFLPPPHTPGEKYCDRCKPTLKVVYASFERKEGWEVIFYDSGTQQRLPVKLNLEDPQKLHDLGQRGQGLRDLAAKQALESAISNGRGGMFLKLTDEQYKRLLRRRIE